MTHHETLTLRELLKTSTPCSCNGRSSDVMQFAVFSTEVIVYTYFTYGQVRIPVWPTAVQGKWMPEANPYETPKVDPPSTTLHIVALAYTFLDWMPILI